jgi:hypothetical protein
MPNSIKYNVSTETLALKKGNFWIGTGDVGKGPTNVTGYYNGITPPAGGFTIYLNKETSGPSIYTVSTEAQLVSLTNTIGAQSFTTSGQCLNWFATQTDKMVFNIDYPAIVTDGLVLNLDAGFTPSYPTINTTWYDVSSGVNNGTLTNGPTYSSANGGSIVFDGSNDYVDFFAPNLGTTTTVEMWCKVNAINSGMMMGWQLYDVYAAYSSMGYNTANSDVYGLTSSQVTSLGLVGNWVQYIFEMKSDVSYVNNKIYINGVSQTLSQITSTENVGARTFNGGYGRISGWRQSTNYVMNMLCNSFRIYNRALTASEVLQNYNAQKSRFGL